MKIDTNMLKRTVNNMKLIKVNKLKIMKLSTSINYCLAVNFGLKFLAL